MAWNRMTKFELKDYIDYVIYKIYNVISDFIYFFNFKSKKILSNNINFFSIHKEDNCFIIGTGPSLNYIKENDLNIINQGIVFGVNSLYKSKIGLLIKPTYYTLMDNLYWGSWNHTFTNVLETYKNVQPTFITDIRAEKILKNLPLNKMPIYLHAKKYPVKKISYDISNNTFALMNVVSYSILTAIYMGCKKIYLLGCDYNAFCSQGYGHCYEDNADVTPYDLAFFLRNYWHITEFHYLLANLAREKCVEIINLTPNSLLDAYPRSTIKEVFSY